MPRRFLLARLLTVALTGMVIVPYLVGEDPPAANGVVSLRGHTDLVYSIAFSPDAEQVATGSFDSTLKVWDAVSGKDLKTYGGGPNGHQGQVLTVAISPNGTLLASGSSDNTARIWDFPTSKPLKEFTFADGVDSVKLSPDGTRAAAGARDGSLRVWNTTDGKDVFRIPAAHQGAVVQVAFSPNGQTLASIGTDRMLRLWNSANGQVQGEIGAQAGTPTGVVINPATNQPWTAGEDGLIKAWVFPVPPARAIGGPYGDAVTALTLTADNNTLVTASADKQVRLINFANGQVVRSLTGPTTAVVSVASAPNNTLVAGGTQDARLWLWNPGDGKALAQPVAHAGAVNGLAFHPNSTQMASAGADGIVKLWALPLIPTRTLAAGDAVFAVAATADGKKVFTGGADRQMLCWNLAAPQQPERKFAGHTGAINAIAVSTNNALLASAGEDEVIRFWNQANSQVTDLYGAHAGPVASLNFAANNQLLSASTDGSIKLWQPPSPANAKRILTHADSVTAAAVSTDGNSLLTGCKDKQVRIWNLQNNQARTLATLSAPVVAVAFNDNAALAAASTDKTVTIWSVADGKEVKKWDLPANLHSLALARDGKQVAVGLADNSVRIFDIAMGKEVRSLTGHKGAVQALVYTAKGDQLISGSIDKTVQVWDLASGQSKLTMAQETSVQALALGKDGRLLSGGEDKAVKIWTLPEGKAVATLPTGAEIRGLALSNDGQRLATAGGDGRVRLFDIDGKLREFFPHQGPVSAVVFHPDGKRVISASADKSAAVWTPALIWHAHYASPVRQALINPAGDRVLSGGDDGTVKLWQGADGKLIGVLKAHTAAIVGVAMSADGTRIASAGADKMVNIWTLPPQLKTTEGLAKPLVLTLPAVPTALSLSPNGTRLAVHALEGKTPTIRVFDGTTGKEAQVFTDHTEPVRALAFLADNRTLLSGSLDKTARLTDQNVTAVLEAHSAGVTGIAYTNANTLVSAGQDKTVKVWDLAQNKLARTFGPLPAPVTTFGLSKDFTQVAVGMNKVVKVLNVADGKEIKTLDLPADGLSLSFSGDKARLLVGCNDKQARVFDLATGQLVQFIPHAAAVNAVSFHPNNTQVITGSADKTVVVNTLALARSIATGADVRGLAVAPDGRVLSAGEDKSVKVCNPSSGAMERTLPGAEKAVNAVAVSKNGQLVAAAGVDQTIRIYTYADGKAIASLKAPAAIRTLAFSPNNLTLAVGHDNNLIQTWSVPFTPGQPKAMDFGTLQQTYHHDAPVTEVVFSNDGSQIWSSSLDKTVRIWKSASDKPIRNLQHPAVVDAVAFNPAGDQLATGCHDGKLRFFDLAKGTLIREVNAHPFTPPSPPNPIYCLAWTADGKQIVTGSFDHSAKLWDTTSGTLVREFKAFKEKDFEKGHTQGIFCLALSPDGKTLATGSSDRTIKLWNTADGTVIRELVNPNLKAPLQPPVAHRGWVYGVRFTPDGKQLISISGAPRNQRSLAVWSVADGKLLSTDDKESGTLYAIALSADGKKMALGTGATIGDGDKEKINVSEVGPVPK